MKIKSKVVKVFQPIELTIMIESEGDLMELWHRLNPSADGAQKVAMEGGLNVGRVLFGCTDHLWLTLEDIRKDQGVSVCPK